MSNCKLCNYLDRAKLETKLLTKSISNAEAGRIVGCSATSISRHMENHVAKYMEQVQERVVKPKTVPAPITGVLDAYFLLENAIKFCDDLSVRAKAANDFNMALMAMAEMRRTIETMSKLFEIHKKQEQDLVSNKVELVITVIR